MEQKFENFEKNQRLYNNISDALVDGSISPKERDDLLLKYNEDISKITKVTSEHYPELKVDLFEYKKNLYLELKEIFQKDINEIKKLQILSGVRVDGVIGPETFAGLLRTISRFPQFKGLSVNQIIESYDDIYVLLGKQFSNKDFDTRLKIQKNIQTSPDGLFGPKTFTSIMQRWDEVKQYFSVILQSKVEGDTVNQIEGIQQANDTTEVFVNKEKIATLIEQARNIPRPLIRLLQASVGTPVDGAFGPLTAQAIIENYPDTNNLSDILNFLNISLASDVPLSEDGSPELFRKQYNPFITELARQFNIPVGLIDSIIGRETTYGANLTHSGGSKGLMQLTDVIFKDMRQPGRRERLFRPLFEKINIENLSHIELGDGTIAGENIPKPILDIFKILSNPKTSNSLFDQNILLLQNYLKGDPNYFNHLTNMIVGSLWLKYHYNKNNGDIFTTARNYNGNPVLRDKYGKNIVERYNSYINIHKNQ